jgi:hypothetical protein
VSAPRTCGKVLTGYRSGSSEAACPGEPQAQFDPSTPLIDRYAAKATELGVAPRTIRRWAAAYQQRGVAGLASARVRYPPQVDPRWSEAALAIMREHTQESKPSRKAVIYQTSKRLEICFRHGVVPEPSQATAYRELKRLEAQHRTFTGTTARNRDIATRPKRPYGKLQPTQPGEYVIRDTTRLDVFGVDPDHIALDSNRAAPGDGLVHPLHRRVAAYPGLDEGGRRGGDDVSGIPPAASTAELARLRGVAASRHPSHCLYRPRSARHHPRQGRLRSRGDTGDDRCTPTVPDRAGNGDFLSRPPLARAAEESQRNRA